MTHGDAGQDARNSAARARVTVTEVESVADLQAVAELIARIWDAPTVAPMPHDLMRSLVHSGGRVHAACRDGQLVGTSVAIFGPPAEASCYSLIAGVSPMVESQGIGLALKLAQRDWALRAGASHMTWTFDPLLRRNARFNITRLGAVVTDYLVDFYGEIQDGVNDPETDRLAITWDLRKPLPHSARSSRPSSGRASAGQDEPPAILFAGEGDEPVLALGPAGTASAQAGRTGADNSPRMEASDAGTGRLKCWIPEDILSIRRADPALARRWRLALREALGGSLDDGYEVTGLIEPAWYALQKARAGI